MNESSAAQRGIDRIRNKKLKLNQARQLKEKSKKSQDGEKRKEKEKEKENAHAEIQRRPVRHVHFHVRGSDSWRRPISEHVRENGKRPQGENRLHVKSRRWISAWQVKQRENTAQRGRRRRRSMWEAHRNRDRNGPGYQSINQSKQSTAQARKRRREQNENDTRMHNRTREPDAGK